MFEAVASVLFIGLVNILAWVFNFAQIWVTWTIARGMFYTAAVPETNLFLIGWLALWIMLVDTFFQIVYKVMENK